MARDYRDLEVWRLAMDLVEAAYRLTREFPKPEEYRLTSQLLRAAVSVPANIAEGNARSTRKDYARFISIARGSLAETETLLMLAQRIGLGRPEEVDAALNKADRIGRMLNGLHQSLEKNNP
jgi:four helix bundle protein